MSWESARDSPPDRVVQIVEPLDDCRRERRRARAATRECHHDKWMVGVDIEWRLHRVRLPGGERIVGWLDPAAAQQCQRREKTGDNLHGPLFRKVITAGTPSTACTVCHSGV